MLSSVVLTPVIVFSVLQDMGTSHRMGSKVPMGARDMEETVSGSKALMVARDKVVAAGAMEGGTKVQLTGF